MKESSVFDPKADSPLSDEALKNKKNRYAHFDAATILPRITKESLATTLEKFEPLGGANAFDHLVFRLYTGDGRVIVCRIHTDTSVANHFLIESALYTRWRTAGISSPEVYTVTLRSEPDGFDFMLIESMGSTDIERHVKAHAEDGIEYARKSGAYLKELHSVPASGFGMLALEAGSLQGEQNTWKEALTVRLEETLFYLAEHHLLSKEEIEKVHFVLDQYDSLLDLRQGVTLHGDYHDANIIIDTHQRAVVAGIDLSQAKVGDPIYDIAFYGTYVSSEKLTVFCEGYFGSNEKPKDFDLKFALYQLRIYLSKAKLRKRFGYDERIPLAIEGITRSLKVLS